MAMDEQGLATPEQLLLASSKILKGRQMTIEPIPSFNRQDVKW